MKNAIIVHGTCSRREYYDADVPSLSNQHWIPWLQKQLIAHDVTAYTPDMPLAFKPGYEIWLREVERFDIGPNTMLVGHSTGGGFWVRWLGEHPRVSVGTIFASDNDHLGIRWSAETLRQKLPGHIYKGFHNYSHFMDITVFPELLSEMVD